MSYEHRYVGGQHNVFSFTTDNEISYEVRFVPSGYLFGEYIDAPVDAYEMIIAVADNPTGGRLPADRLIPSTVRAIFYEFFQRNEQVVIFICDDSDGRQSARARKFTSWFYDDRPNFIKLDAKIPDAGNTIFMSAILKASNPYFSELADLFRSFGSISK